MYTVLARKWRPQIFEDLVGQHTVTQTLQNSISAGRVAHAFLFSGPRGVGKTSCARLLAKALNCHSSESPVTTPCNQCPSCLDVAASRSMDVLEIDGASNRGIDEVRELRESAKYQGMRDRFRIFIIDEVHMLTTEAFNALLKILEEPPPHVYFIFATTELRKVPPTIVSRCQMFDFKKIPDRLLVQRLSQITKEEDIEIPEKSLEMIASASEGGLRDALGILDQIIAFSGPVVDPKNVEAVLGLVDAEVMMELGEAIAKSETGEVLRILDRISEYGIDYRVFYHELLAFYRDLFLIRFQQDSQSEDSDQFARYRQLAGLYEDIHLLRICHQLVQMQSQMRLSGNLRFLFELTLVRICQIQRLVPIEDLVQDLKKKQSGPSLKRPVEAIPNRGPAHSPPENREKRDTLSEDFVAALISQLEDQNPRLAAALENAVFQQNGTNVNFFIPETYFGMMKLDAGDQLDLETILRKNLGDGIQVRIHKGTPPAESAALKVATPETVVQNDPIIQEFVKAFRGKISRIDFNKERYL